MRPSYAHPGNRYGRPTGCPGPCLEIPEAPLPEPEWFTDESLAPSPALPLTPGAAWREMLDF